MQTLTDRRLLGLINHSLAPHRAPRCSFVCLRSVCQTFYCDGSLVTASVCVSVWVWAPVILWSWPQLVDTGCVCVWWMWVHQGCEWWWRGCMCWQPVSLSALTCAPVYGSDFSPDPGSPPERGPDEPHRGQDALHPGVAVAAWVRNHSLPRQVSFLSQLQAAKNKRRGWINYRCFEFSLWIVCFQVPGREAGGADRYHLQPPDPDGRQHRGRHQDLALQQHEAVERQLGDQDGTGVFFCFVFSHISDSWGGWNKSKWSSTRLLLHGCWACCGLRGSCVKSNKSPSCRLVRDRVGQLELKMLEQRLLKNSYWPTHGPAAFWVMYVAPCRCTAVLRLTPGKHEQLSATNVHKWRVFHYRQWRDESTVVLLFWSMSTQG